MQSKNEFWRFSLKQHRFQIDYYLLKFSERVYLTTFQASWNFNFSTLRKKRRWWQEVILGWDHTQWHLILQKWRLFLRYLKPIGERRLLIFKDDWYFSSLNAGGYWLWLYSNNILILQNCKIHLRIYKDGWRFASLKRGGYCLNL